MGYQCDYCGDTATWIVYSGADRKHNVLMCDCCQFEYNEYFPLRMEYCERLEGLAQEELVAI